MENGLVNITQRHVFRSLSYTVLFDTVIALILTGIKLGGGFVVNFIISQCIGISICSLFLTALFLFRPANPLFMLVLVMIAIITGTLAGWILGFIAAGKVLSISLFDRSGAFTGAPLLMPSASSK